MKIPIYAVEKWLIRQKWSDFTTGSHFKPYPCENVQRLLSHEVYIGNREMTFRHLIPQENKMKKYISMHYPARIARAVRDGLIVILGITVTLGTYFNSEITMWAAGA